MAIAYADFIERCKLAQQEGKALCRRSEFETEDGLPESLGDGSQRYIYLRNGLTINIRNVSLRQTLHIEHQHESNFPLVAKFCLSGASRVRSHDLPESKADYTEIAGCHYLYHLPHIEEIEEWPSHQHHQVVMVYAPPDYFRSFYQMDAPLEGSLQQLLNGDNAQQFHHSLGAMTPLMSQILQQILQVPYAGMMQHLYLEGKALELLWNCESSIYRSR